jgi:hypothetical protein
MATKTSDTKVIDIQPLNREALNVHIVGTTPLFCNKLPEKAKRELIFPPKANTRKRSNELKHDPVEEYRNSVPLVDEGPTAIAFPAPAFKKALIEAAPRVGGAFKTEIAQLVRVMGYSVPIYGVPRLSITGVRQANAARTPDMRTRAVLPEWACTLQIAFVRPNLTPTAVLNLLQAAGEVIGIGDWRQEKGAGDNGLWRITTEEDPEFIRICEQGGREAQLDALKNYEPFDRESADLLEWFFEEAKRRGIEVTR